MTHEGMRSTGWRGLQHHAYILYLTSLVTFTDWPAEFIISHSQGNITAMNNIRITRSTKRQNMNVIVFSWDKNIYIESETSTVDIITKKTTLI